MTGDTATIKTAWFWRKQEEGPELLEAWDEFTVDSNPDGWREAVDAAYAAVESDDSGHGIRYIDVKINYGVVERAFWPVEVEGQALSFQDKAEAEYAKADRLFGASGTQNFDQSARTDALGDQGKGDVNG